MSSRTERKRRRRLAASGNVRITIVDDVVSWPPRITDGERRELERLKNDATIVKECASIVPMVELPGDVLAVSDKGRMQ